ncbi:NAD(P)-binding domain-containing protein [bacterium]|nr:NAD(P)-binding domain-containing protein [bacterium]
MNNNAATIAEVAIVGAGPIGLELGAALKRYGIPYLHFDAGQIGASIGSWPPHTHFYSAPERCAIAGFPAHSIDQNTLTCEHYLAYLRGVVEQLDLPVHVYHKVTDIEQTENGFRLTTICRDEEKTWEARRVVLATGGMSHPNLLDIPGEDSKHVSHQLGEPHRYFRQRLVIVGGKNSALEAALRCYRAGADASISYLQREFDLDEVKPHLALEIEMLIEKGQIGYYPETKPTAIHSRSIELQSTDGSQKRTVDCDFVLLCTGYRADMKLFRQLGVELEGDAEAPQFDEETMQTNVPGVYVAGTAAGGSQQRYELYIETCHHHVEKIMEQVTGQPVQVPTGSVPARNYKFELADIQPDD